MSADQLRWQDEILQLMFWMRGEKLARQVTQQELTRFLALTPEQVEIALARLLSSGLLLRMGSGALELSERGIKEGKRRFVEEFTPYLGKESHFECNDPDCECHSPEFVGVCKNLGRDT